jgi:NtrC-family two-component system sensor histidine kinase KinB
MTKHPYYRVGPFKGILFLTAILLALSLLIYTRVMVDSLRDHTRSVLSNNIQHYRFLLSSVSAEMALDEINRIDYPVILTDSDGNPKFWKNVGIAPNDTSAEAERKLRRVIHKMDASGNQPIPIEMAPNQVDYFHYGDSLVIKQLTWLPVAEIIAVALFILIGYLGFQNIRRNEERSVWIGLAKETAHQLGTPLTSLLGWLEVLGDPDMDPQVAKDAYAEMKRDLSRLEQIAARFSQIGSEVVLTEESLTGVIKEAVDYFRQRLPSDGKPVTIFENYEVQPRLPLNRTLFSWVMENLLKNSMDALGEDGGTITITSREKGGKVLIEVKDTGKGIDPKDRKYIFRPGFSTKKRGWGLGLSLAKRIVEEYHRGKLLLRLSRPGAGTTMRIQLSKVS